MQVLRMVCFLCCVLFQAESVAAADLPPEDLSAGAAILIEANTGEVIYEKNGDVRIYPASTTKMMTAIVALENGNIDDVVTVGKNAESVEGSSMNLLAGDRLSVRELLYGVMMASGNDATIAIAEHIDVSVAKFAERMTQKAKEIGADNTHFVNSSGLPDPAHYSTAHDLARIARYGYHNEVFRKIVGTAARDVKWIEPAKSEKLENTNLLLRDYQGANGIKTGYTEAAGECLVASAERGDKALIAVVMHVDKDKRFAEASKLLDYGFGKVQLHKAYGKNDLIRKVHVRGGRNYQVRVRPQREIMYPFISEKNLAAFSVEMALPQYVAAPIKEGQDIGYVRIMYENQEIGRVELVSDQTIAEGFNPIALIIEWYDTLFETLKMFVWEPNQ